MISAADVEITEPKQIYLFDQETKNPPDAELKDDTDQNEQGPPLQQKKPVKDILFVDDEGQLCEIFRKALVNFGYTVRVALNGEEGLKLFLEKPADLIITDIFMPEKDGHTFIHEIMRDFPEANIFAITGYKSIFGMEMELDIAETLGAKRVFTKPVRVIELVKAIKELDY